MIIQEPCPGHEDSLIKTYSDQDVKIRQIETGVLYGEAVDIFPCPYTYEETDIPIETIDYITNHK